jgi:aspartate racemase
MGVDVIGCSSVVVLQGVTLERVRIGRGENGVRREGSAVKTIGLLGGMSWESSVLYEEIINSEVRRRLGGVHSAEILLRSYDFARIEALQAAGDWDAAGRVLAADARRLQDAGADLVLLCTNTMHRVARDVESALDVPLLHIADATAAAVAAAGVSRVALLGTRYTMEQDFYRGRLEDAGLAVLVPDEPDRTTVHDVIYEELVQGRIEERSRRAFVAIVDRLMERGAAGVIAGCTEIELLIGPGDVPCPLFPTTRIHALAAVEAALEG